jgi:hypothetical protein
MVPEPVWPTGVAASGAYCPPMSARADEPHIVVLQRDPFGLFVKHKPAHSAQAYVLHKHRTQKTKKPPIKN